MGTAHGERTRLVRTARERLEALIAFVRERAADSDPAYQQHVNAGHVERYEQDIAFLNDRYDYLTEALVSNKGGVSATHSD